LSIETYLLIAFVYGLGCFLSYRAGRLRGHMVGVRMFAFDIKKVLRLNDDEMLTLVRKIKEAHERKAAK
jgi:hypothetical protein